MWNEKCSESVLQIQVNLNVYWELNSCMKPTSYFQICQPADWWWEVHYCSSGPPENTTWPYGLAPPLSWQKGFPNNRRRKLVTKKCRSKVDADFTMMLHQSEKDNIKYMCMYKLVNALVHMYSIVPNERKETHKITPITSMKIQHKQFIYDKT